MNDRVSWAGTQTKPAPANSMERWRTSFPSFFARPDGGAAILSGNEIARAHQLLGFACRSAAWIFA